MTQDGTRAAGEHRGHPPAFIAEAPMPDGVNPAMKAVKAVGLNPAPSTVFADSGAHELCHGDDTVLVCRDSGDEGVRIIVGAFPPHVGR